MNLNFQNTATKYLPVDPIRSNYTREVKNACLSLVNPSPVENPQLICYSQDALKLLEVIENEEKNVQEKLRKVSGKKKIIKKDW